MTGGAWEVVLFAAAGTAGIALALVASALIGHLDRRGSFSVFGWVDSDDASQGRLSVYVSNKTRAATVVREAGVVRNDGSRMAAEDTAESGLLLRPLPLSVDPGELTVVCVIPFRPANAINHLTGCYVIRDAGRVVTGRIFRRGEGSAARGTSFW